MIVCLLEGVGGFFNIPGNWLTIILVEYKEEKKVAVVMLMSVPQKGACVHSPQRFMFHGKQRTWWRNFLLKNEATQSQE